MKRIAFLLVLVIFTSLAHAQDGQGRRDPAQMKEMMKQSLKEELKFSDQLADSVVTIQMEYQLAAREARNDEVMTEDEKNATAQKLVDIRDSKLKGILNAQQFAAFHEYTEKMRMRRGERKNAVGK
jgi:hypothetical protein